MDIPILETFSLNGEYKPSTDGGIYCLLCDSPKYKRNIVYIGSTKNYKERFRDHKCLLNTGSHHNLYLQNIFNKHGRFSFCIVEPLEDIETRAEVEQEYIDQYNPLTNFKTAAKASGGQPHTYIACSPNDEWYIVPNLGDFLVEKSLNFNRRKVSSLLGEGGSFLKGWFFRKAKYNEIKDGVINSKRKINKFHVTYFPNISLSMRKKECRHITVTLISPYKGNTAEPFKQSKTFHSMKEAITYYEESLKNVMDKGWGVFENRHTLKVIANYLFFIKGIDDKELLSSAILDKATTMPNYKSLEWTRPYLLRSINRKTNRLVEDLFYIPKDKNFMVAAKTSKGFGSLTLEGKIRYAVTFLVSNDYRVTAVNVRRILIGRKTLLKGKSSYIKKIEKEVRAHQKSLSTNSSKSFFKYSALPE